MGDGNPSITLYYDESEYPSFFIRDNVGAGVNLNYPVTQSFGVWQHVVGVKRATSITIYQNGVEVANTSHSLSGDFDAGATNRQIGRQSYDGGNNYFNGAIDEVRVYNRALSAAEVNALYRAGQAKLGVTKKSSFQNGLIGHWTFDGPDISGTTAYDRSGQGNNGTLTNGPAATAGIVGQSLQFDGSDDRVQTAANQLYQIATRTVSAWIYPRTMGSGGFGGIATMPSNGGITSFYFSLCNSDATECPSTANTMELWVRRANNDVANWFVTAANSITLNSWNHVAFTYDCNSTANDPILYINGIAVGITEQNAPVGGDCNEVGVDKILYIGSNNNFDGKIDDVRIYNRILSSDEIFALYKSAQPSKLNSSASQSQGTGRLDSGLQSYWKLDETTGSSAADASTNGFTGTLTNMENGDWVAGQIGNGLDFDGVDEYVTTSSPVPDQGTAAAWVNANFGLALSSSYTFLGSAAAGNHFELGADTYAGYDTWFVELRGGYGSYVTLQGPTYTSDSQIQGWHHVVGTWDTAKGIKLYIDGSLAASTTQTTGTIGGALNFDIGRQSGGGVWKGKVDEVRVYNRELSADEIAALYRTTAPTSIDTGLKGYWSFNGPDISGTTAYDRSGAGNNGTLTNGPAKTIGKVGQALDFFSDGTDSNEYVDMGDPGDGDLDFGTGNFTVSTWAYVRGYSNQGSSINTLLSKRNMNSPNTAGYGLSYYSDTKPAFIIGDGTSDTELVAPQSIANGWHLVTGVRSGSTMYLYVDGVMVDSDTPPAGSTSNTQYFYVSAGGDVDLRNVDGKIDEVRVYNRALSADEIKLLYNQGR